MQEYLYTVPEIAKILKVSKNDAYDLIKSGHLTALKLGSLKVTNVELLRFLEKYNGKDLSNLKEVKPLVFQ